MRETYIFTGREGGRETERERQRETESGGEGESLQEFQETYPYRAGRREISTKVEKMQPLPFTSEETDAF